MAWDRVKDQESGDFYYWNTETNETQWDRPEDFQSEAETEEKDAVEVEPEHEPNAEAEEEKEAPKNADEKEARKQQESQSSAKGANYSAEYAKYCQDYYAAQSQNQQHYVQDPNSYLPYQQYYAAGYYNNLQQQAMAGAGAMGQYASKGFFNTKTGRFESRLGDRLSSLYSHGSDAKATRQMNHFFDFDSWALQRGAEAAAALASTTTGGATTGQSTSSSSAVGATVSGETKEKPSKKELKHFKKKKQQIKLKKREWLFK